MPLIPRDYQDAGVTSIFDYFAAKTGNPLLAMPTGTGKSVVIAEFLRRVYRLYPSERTMCVTHVKELIGQNLDKLLQAWPTAPAGVFSAGLGKKESHCKITFAGIASVAKKAHLFGFVSLLIIDEAHLVGPEDSTRYVQFINDLKKVNPQLKVIGLSATVWRLGHGKLHEDHPIFTDVCFDMTSMDCFNWLFDQGYLCRLVPKRTEVELDTDGVHMRGGDFSLGDLQAAVDKDGITRAALTEAVQLAGDRWSWLVFCSGVEHSIHVAAMLTSIGIPCKAVHSNSKEHPQSDAERDSIIADWKAGKLRAVANNNVLTTGIDHPALSCIVMLRPTMSAVLWVQMLGRGTRPFYSPGFLLDTQQGRLDAIQASHKQDCLVLDFARNTQRLGPINDPVIPKKKGEKVGEAPVKVCPECKMYNHASARECEFCGFEFPRHGPAIAKQASTDELIRAAMPVVEVYEVRHITFGMHTKVGKPPSMMVTYWTKFRAFRDFVCFEHQDGFSQRKAARWWRERTDNAAVPATTAEALQWAEQLKAPTHIRVHINKQFPEVLAGCYDGTAFGTQAPSGVKVTTKAERGFVPSAPRPAAGSKPLPGFDDMDDDIPF